MSDNPSDYRPADTSTHEWSEFASCVNRFEYMFPTDSDWQGIDAARSICAECPVRFECLTEAMDNGEQFGMWGGLTPAERTSMRRRVSRNNLRVRNEGVGELMHLEDLIEAAATDATDVINNAIESEDAA